MRINIAVEGFTDEIVVRQLLSYVGLECGLVRGRNGKADLIKQISNYNQAARFARWLVVVDLDQDEDCAPAYIQILLPNPSQGMLLRIPVRAVEAWLMADRDRLAAYLGIAIENIPINPDQELNPKMIFISLAKRSRRTSLREDMVPRIGSGARVGPGYPSRIQEFVAQSRHRWRPEVAAEHSDSLKRCIQALERWKLAD